MEYAHDEKVGVSLHVESGPGIEDLGDVGCRGQGIKRVLARARGEKEGTLIPHQFSVHRLAQEILVQSHQSHRVPPIRRDEKNHVTHESLTRLSRMR